MKLSHIIILSLLTTPVFAEEATEAAKSTATAETATTETATPTEASKPAATKATAPAEEVQADAMSEADKLSYAFGFNFGHMLKKREVEVNLDVLTAGLNAALAGEEGKMSQQDIAKTLIGFMAQQKMKEQAKLQMEIKKNKDAGAAFLAENKSKEGVVELESGLQYKIIKAGEGKTPTAEDSVSVHYRGTLIDGKEFDSSHKRGQPATFQVGGVIKGWTEALQLMKVGAKWELYIPAEIAYGERSTGNIPAGSTLIFEVELLDVKSKETEKTEAVKEEAKAAE